MVISTPTLYSQFKESYKIISVIIGIAVVIQLSSNIQVEFFEYSLVTSAAIAIFPLCVAIASFVVSRTYGGSKVFGKSYFLLSLSYLAFFIGEGLYFFYFDPFDNYEYTIISEVLFTGISMPLLLIHIIINIRYFAEKLEIYQKILLVVIPAIVILGYSWILMSNAPENMDDFYFNLISVVASSIILGFTVVAFTLFRETVLFTPWFLLLIGILFSTAGDVLYRYTDTMTAYDYGDPTTSLWLAASMMVVYALYKHQKSI